MVSDIQKLIDAGKKYLEIRIELFKLDTKDQVSQYLMRAGLLFCGVMLLVSIALFLSVGIAFYINTLLQSYYLGFFIMAGFFFLLLILLLALRKNKNIRAFFNQIVDLFIFD